MRTARAARGGARGEHARAREQLAAGGAPQAIVERQLEAAHADDRVWRHPCASSAARREAGSARPCRAPRSPVRPSGELRVELRRLRVAGAARGLSASTLPSRASSVARRGRAVRRLSSSPGRRPGNASERDQAMRVPSPPSTTVDREVERERAEQAGVHAHGNRHARRRARRARLPVDAQARRPSPWSALPGRRAANSPREIARREAASMSEYIAA